MSDDRFVPYSQAMSTQAEQLDAVVARVREQLPDAAALLRSTRPVFVGIGASLAAAAAPVHALRARGVAAHRAGLGDLPDGCPPLGDALVAVSQSGRSRETVEAVAAASGVRRAAVVNVPGSPLTQVVDSVVDLGDQSDSKASTIGFTGTLAGLGLLADAWDAPRPAPQGSDDAWSALGGAVAALEQQVGTALGDLAALVGAAASVDVSGEQASVASAEEGALLLREVCRVAATPFELRGYLHGPTESASSGQFPTAHVLVGGERSLELAAQLQGRGHSVAVLTTLPAEAVQAAGLATSTVVVRLPDVAGPQRVVLETVVFQHVSGLVAAERGLDADEFVFSSTDTKLDDAVASPGPR
jgi:glucosamine--fructose-6-phosphate aminotransferase (isomerizing)